MICIKENIKNFICDIVEIGTPIDYSTHLYTSGIINSMRHIQLVNFLESEYSIVIPISAINIENFNTIDSIEEFMSNMVKNKAGDNL